MTHDDTIAVPHRTCPFCHMPIEDGQSSINHGGHSFHDRCAPVPEMAGAKDEPYPSLITI